MPAEATLPDAQTAYNTLVTNVSNAVFFHKCAAAGISPRNDEEAYSMLECAAKLASLEEHEVVKAAAAKDNPFHQLTAAVDGLMGKFGISQPTKEAHDNYVAATREFAKDPAIYNSVLALKAAQAEEISKRYAPAA